MTHIDIDAVTSIIREVAAEEILPRFRNLKAGDVAYKSGDDPVTIADQKAESALSSRLLDLLKGSKTVGEEAFAANQSVSDRFFGESPVWIIDPIDGTRNFVGGNPEFGVIVALAEQNQTIAGWLYDPTSDEVVTVEKGSGAWHKGKKLKVLGAESLKNMKGILSQKLIELYEKANISNDVKPVFELMSSGVHDYPRLMVGVPHFGKDKPQLHFRASLFQSMPWDDAAGVLVHEEAGGYAARWNGEPYQLTVTDQGLALAPDKESWHAFRAWCRTFADLP